MTPKIPKIPGGPKPSGSSSSEDTRERLIEAATQLFEQKGFDGVSVKELADSAGVNVSLVSYHFGGKENLYRACLEQFGQARLEVAQRVLQPPQTIDELRFRLKMFLEEIFNAHFTNGCVGQLIHRECELGLPVAEEVFRNTFLKVWTTLVGFFEGAQKAGLVRKELDPELVSTQVMGGALHLVRSDKIASKFFNRTIQEPIYRARVIENILQISLFGFAVQPAESRLSPSSPERSPS